MRSISQKMFTLLKCAALIALFWTFLQWYSSVRLSLKLQIQQHEEFIEATKLKIYELESQIEQMDDSNGFLAQFRKSQSPGNDQMNDTIDSLRFRYSQTLPRAFQLLPHLRGNPNALEPSLIVSKGRRNVTFALGIPTICRDKISYLKDTLANITSSMNEAERRDTVIIVFIGELEMDKVTVVANEIQNNFAELIDSGLVEIIAPHPSFYPDFSKLRLTLQDKLERVKWRSKQNLDYSYLMTYAQPKAKYYVQLEDDIVTVPQFITAMKTQTESVPEPWYVLDFCDLGFIGKLFKSSDLSLIVTFFQMFFNDKPVDWLIHHYVDTYTCNLERDFKICQDGKKKFWLRYKTSLFQHVGKFSSFKGKIQRLQDKHFGKLIKKGHINPPAVIKTSITSQSKNKLEKVYEGAESFLGVSPLAGDTVEFIFPKPIRIKGFIFSGGYCLKNKCCIEHTTIEVLPETHYGPNSDYFVTVGSFNSKGIAEGGIDPTIGRVKEVRLNVQQDIGHQICLAEVNFDL